MGVNTHERAYSQRQAGSFLQGIRTQGYPRCSACLMLGESQACIERFSARGSCFAVMDSGGYAAYSVGVHWSDAKLYERLRFFGKRRNEP